MLRELSRSATDWEEIRKIEDWIKEIQEKLRDGYERLIGFETETKGYEWFGKVPGHEALTAYGIAQFRDMQDVVFFVDQSAIDRNLEWLESRRATDGSGKFQLNGKALDSFGYASPEINQAYIVWVLTSIDKYTYSLLYDEFQYLESVYQESTDPYFYALYSGCLYNVGKVSEALSISSIITTFQNSTGAVLKAKSSITKSQGKALILETTALSVVNWIIQDSDLYLDNIERGINYIVESIEDGGRFSSTQATILCLKALILYVKFLTGISGQGTFDVAINDKVVQSINFKEGEMDTKYLFNDKLNDYFKENREELVNGFVLTLEVQNYKYLGKSNGFQVNYYMENAFKVRMPP